MNNNLFSIDAEQSLLGGLLISCKAYSDLEHFKFTSDDFYDAVHKAIFQAMLSLVEKKQGWDAVIVRNELEALKITSVNADYLLHLIKNTPGVANIQVYAEIVKEKAILRSLLAELDNASKSAKDAAAGSDDILNACLKSINALRDSKLVTSHKADSLNSSFAAFRAYIDKRRASTSDYDGIISTLPTLDNLTSGFCNGHMLVVAARPSVGKSALGLYFAGRALMQGKHVLFWSTEMNNNTILARLFSNFCTIPASNLTHFPKALNEKDLAKLDSWHDSFDTLYVESGYPSISQLCDKAKKMRKQGMLDFIVVDYLQNIKGEGEGTVEKLNDVSNRLKQLAMELDVPVVALAQLNRQAQHLDVPTMAEIKGSGAIEQDADLVLILHQNPIESPERYWLLCAKNRHGETKNIPLIFDKPFQNFKEDKSIHRILSKKTTREAL